MAPPIQASRLIQIGDEPLGPPMPFDEFCATGVEDPRRLTMIRRGFELAKA